jgi:FKBP-type peptidyl-prolyl cis-trans isomerase FklB
MGSLAATAQVKKPATKPAAKPATASTAPTLKTRVDSVSYAIGILDGSFFKNQGITKINSSLLGKGFSDAIGGKPLLTPEQCNDIVRVEMEAMKQAKVKPTIEEGEKFLAANKQKTGVKVTPSGLQYEVITMGTGPKPTDTSRVKVHYDGTLLNGQKFDSSRDRGEPLVFSLQEVVKGWTEGLQLMPVGSRFKLYIPYQLGWGLQGSPPTIPGGAAVIFDVELIDIVNTPQ